MGLEYCRVLAGHTGHTLSTYTHKMPITFHHISAIGINKGPKLRLQQNHIIMRMLSNAHASKSYYSKLLSNTQKSNQFLSKCLPATLGVSNKSSNPHCIYQQFETYSTRYRTRMLSDDQSPQPRHRCHLTNGLTRYVGVGPSKRR